MLSREKLGLVTNRVEPGAPADGLEEFRMETRKLEMKCVLLPEPVEGFSALRMEKRPLGTNCCVPAVPVDGFRVLSMENSGLEM